MNDKLKKKIAEAKEAKLNLAPKKLYKVVDNSSTKYLPTPLEVGELVEWVSDVEGEENYIKVRHGKDKEAVSVFARHRFKRFIQKVK